MPDKSDIGVTRRVREAAYRIILEHPDGIRFSELVAELRRIYPELNYNMINTQVAHLRNHPEYTGKLESREKVGRIYKAKDSVLIPNTVVPTKIDESSFYQGFCDYLENNLAECTVAKVFGEHRTFRKFGNPDVVGMYKLDDTVPFLKHPEIVSAELKIDGTYNNLITGFGQASAYLLFSHKSYLVVPRSSEGDGLDAIESLCMMQGIGLVTFDEKDVNEPAFELRNRANRHEPDYQFYNTIGVEMIKFLQRR